MKSISEAHPLPPPISYTVRTAAAAVGVSPSTIKRAIRAGALPYSRLNSKTRLIRRADLDTWLLNMQAQPWTPRVVERRQVGVGR